MFDELELNLSSFEPLPEEGFNDEVETTSDEENEDIKFSNGFEPVPEDLIESNDIEVEDKEEIKNSSTSKNDNLYRSFASELKEENLLEDEDLDKISSLDDLVSAIQSKYERELENSKEEYLASTSKQFRDFLKEQNINVEDKESFFLSKSEDDFNDDEKLANDLIKYYYSSIKGLEADEVAAIVDNEIDPESKAKRIYKELKKRDEATQVKLKESFKEKENLQRKQAEEFEKSLFENTKKLNDFAGYKMNDTKAKELFNDIPNVMKEIQANLVEYAPKIALMKKLGFFDGNFETLIKKGETKQAKKFDELLQNKSNSFQQKKYQKDPNINSWDK